MKFLPGLKKLREYKWLLIIIFFGVSLRFYRLDNLPAAMWGDVIEGYKYAQNVMNGEFYWSFIFGGDGPLFSYLISFMAILSELSFYTIKLTSTLVGVLLIIATYFFTKELFNKQAGLFASFLIAVSKWPLIFSRMGKPHILVPLFGAMSLYYLLRSLHTDNKKTLMITGSLMGLGMYTQSGFWGVPFAVIIVYLYFKKIKNFQYLLFPFLVLIIPLINDFLFVREITSGGSFFGEKLGLQMSLAERMVGYLDNFGRNLLMFHYKGGLVFRNNPPGSTQVDFISGVLLLVGLYFLIKKNQKEKLFIILSSLIFIQIPAILDVTNPDSVPNAGRSIGLIPPVFALIGFGLYQLSKNLEIKPQIYSKLFLSMVLIFIFVLNFKQVFVDYPKTLPNRNVPFGKLIASRIDELEKDTEVYVSGCCWGEWGQPEPNSIRFNLDTNREINFFQADDNQNPFLCTEDVKSKSNLFFVVDPGKIQQNTAVKECFPNALHNSLRSDGFLIAEMYFVE